MSEQRARLLRRAPDHRFLVLYEAAGMDSDFDHLFLRSLLSEGRLRYETVEKTSEGMKPRLIEREGPTGLIVTTTAVKLHPENETRMLSLTVTDTQEQTREVMAALAEESAGEPPDLGDGMRFKDGSRRPTTRRAYLTRKTGRTDTARRGQAQERLRRFAQPHRARAILHQASRERDAEGRIVATLEDYAR